MNNPTGLILLSVLSMAFMLLYDLFVISYFSYNLSHNEVEAMFKGLKFPYNLLLRGYSKTVNQWKDGAHIGFVIFGALFTVLPIRGALTMVERLQQVMDNPLTAMIYIINISLTFMLLICPFSIRYKKFHNTSP